MSFRIAEFNNFAAGEFGSQSPLSAPPNSFTGNNVIRYLDGTIGPRPGFSALAPTGLPTADVMGLGAVTGASHPKIVWLRDNGDLHGFNYPNGADASLGSTSVTALRSELVNFGSKVLAPIPGGGVFQYDNAATAFTHLSSAPAGPYALAVYGRRLVSSQAVGTTPANRIFFSDPDDFTSWPALNTFDVSNSLWGTSFMQEVNGRLSIANQGDEWWSLTGTPGVNDVLRRAPRADMAPLYPWCATRVGESLWFLPENEAFPVQFTTSVVQPLHYRYLQFSDSGNATTRSAAALSGLQCIAFADSTSNRALVFYNGAWTFHTLGVTPNFLSPAQEGGAGISDTPLILADNTGSKPAFYQWAPYLDRPGKVSDTVAQPGDGSVVPLDASFTTPVFHSGFVRRGHQFFEGTGDLTVEVNFNKWNTEAAKSNHIGLQVRGLYRLNNKTVDSDVKTWDESPSATTADKSPARHRFRFGDQGDADSYQLVFTDLRGVAIEDIQVYRDA